MVNSPINSIFLCVIVCISNLTAGFSQLLQVQNDREQLFKDLKTLSSSKFKGRKSGTIGAFRTQKYLELRLKQIGIHAERQVFTILKRDEPGVNIIGRIHGSTSQKIVITAHYDHLGKSKNLLYPGADDNASGVSAVLLMASRLINFELEKEILIVFTDAEEIGFQGSKALLEEYELAHDQIFLNINLDMIGRSRKNEIYAVGTSIHPQFKEPLIAINQSFASVKILFGHDTNNSNNLLEDSAGPNWKPGWKQRSFNPQYSLNKRRDNWVYTSDHYLFYKHGIPFIYFGVEEHTDYHTPRDTYDRIDQEFYFDVCMMLVEFVKALASNH